MTRTATHTDLRLYFTVNSNVNNATSPLADTYSFKRPRRSNETNNYVYSDWRRRFLLLG